MDGIPDDEDSEPVMLSDSTLAILKQFLTEREVGEKEAENDPFSENWGMSQVRTGPSQMSESLKTKTPHYH